MNATLQFAPGEKLEEWLAAIGPRWLAALDAGVAQPAPPLAPALPLSRLARALSLDADAIRLIELLTAAELDETLARRLAELSNGDPAATITLVRRLLPGLDLRVLALAAPLRAHEIIRLSEGPRALARLRLAEPALDRLCGGEALDPGLSPALRYCPPGEPASGGTNVLAAVLAERDPGGLSPIIALSGARIETAAAMLGTLGLVPFRLAPAALPTDPVERARWGRLWARDAALMDAALIVPAHSEPNMLADLLDGLISHVVLLGAPPLAGFARAVRPIAFAPAPADETWRWERAFGPFVSRRMNGSFAGAAQRFHLDNTQIAQVASSVGAELAAEPDAARAERILWRAAARAVPPTVISGVASREPTAGWDDLVLPDAITDTLRRIEGHVRHAERVMEGWGFARRMGGRGVGVAALFAGPSGTGKTLAAEVLAAALDLPMLVVDLAQLTSKYIGETSKNIAAAFEEATRTGAVMIWNEGEAVFGARGNVSNATDRHVNAEVGDLLQRIESFTGFTIITTNIKSAIDPAFLRRFRFVVDFPMPSEVERLAIWRRVFPEAVPLVLGEPQWAMLARIALSGAAIRNAALNSAFLAAEAQQPIDLAMIADSLASELAKTGQPMPVLAAMSEGAP